MKSAVICYSFFSYDISCILSDLLEACMLLFIRRVNNDYRIILLVGAYVAGQTNLRTESSCTVGAGGWWLGMSTYLHLIFSPAVFSPLCLHTLLLTLVYLLIHYSFHLNCFKRVHIPLHCLLILLFTLFFCLHILL